MFNAEDRARIFDLNARYCLSVDERRFDDWASCFTPDGVFDAPPLGRFQGRAELIRCVAEYAKALGDARQRHLITNISLDLEAERGTGVSNFTLYVTRNGATQFMGVGTYRDELRKLKGEWYFHNREVSMDTNPPGNIVVRK
jgi:3-phenylpropionate/cinnamic acid dioxygenase small subunit